MVLEIIWFAQITVSVKVKSEKDILADHSRFRKLYINHVYPIRNPSWVYQLHKPFRIHLRWCIVWEVFRFNKSLLKAVFILRCFVKGIPTNAFQNGLLNLNTFKRVYINVFAGFIILNQSFPVYTLFKIFKYTQLITIWHKIDKWLKRIQ